jgi:hypothetical protein
MKKYARKLKRIKKIIRFPKMLLWALWLEGDETKKMMQTYLRHGASKILISKTPVPTEEELAQAREQLKDIPRFLPFFVIIAVPAPGVTEGYAFLAVTLEKFLGKRFRLLPTRIREVVDEMGQKEEEE